LGGGEEAGIGPTEARRTRRRGASVKKELKQGEGVERKKREGKKGRENQNFLRK